MERVSPTVSGNVLEADEPAQRQRTWFDVRPSSWRPPIGDEAADFERTSRQKIRALFVNGPASVNRHILLDDRVTIGRDPGAGVVVDDPGVSRAHAVLGTGPDRTTTLADAGSANGTFLGGIRLPPGEPRPLVVGQTFFVGSSALVIQALDWPAPRFQRAAPFESIREQIAAIGQSWFADGPPPLWSAVVLRVSPARATPAALLEALLGSITRASRSWILPISSDQILMVIEAAATDAAALERAVFRQLASWGLSADVEAVALTYAELQAPAEDLARQLHGRAPLRLKRGKVVLRDPAMERLASTVRRVAPANVSVLILGETGSGKDIVASMIHEFSTRADRPFLGMNCASVPEALLESELFGHERGAFTGATSAKKGLLEAAQGGTVFLDEIGDLPLSLQAKLLRVIESHEVLPVGAVRPRHVDVRFLAATNQDIAGVAAAGRFRRDLLYRLNCVTLTVPPLRERRGEIEPLAQLFLSNACERFGLGPPSFSPGALAELVSYAWPGNVRELRNVVERAVLLAPSGVIEGVHLDLDREATTAAVLGPPALEVTSGDGASQVRPVLDAEITERDRVLNALAACGGNQSRAAKFLGVSRRTLVRQIGRLGLPRPRRNDE